MPALDKISRLTSSIPGFPDLKIDPFALPHVPLNLIQRYPEMRQWELEFNERFLEWQSHLQNSIREALQALEAQK